MAEASQTVRDFIATFLLAWRLKDASRLTQFFSEEAEYRNGPLPPVIGRDAVVAALGQMMAMGGTVDVDITNMVSDGPLVMVERVDYWRNAEKTIQLPVAGVFEVRDGVIAIWRDYFDLGEFTSQMAEDKD